MHKFLEAVVSFVNPLYGICVDDAQSLAGLGEDGVSRFFQFHETPEGLGSYSVFEKLCRDPAALRALARELRRPGANEDEAADKVAYEFARRYCRQYARLQAREAVPAEA